MNIGSVTSTYGVGGISIYGATKAAVAQLTKTLAVEWAPNNIQVNCLAPGFIITPMNEIAVWGDKRRRDWILARTPMKRPGTVEDLEGTCVMLCSHASDFLTGELITIDGGFISGGWWDTD